ncbi:hypothetical protein LCGC14_0630720 [marine sediment metagenome]|uniref:Thymidylate synthase (FAD) n=1 Tax=marine sediment metagenome TaxID=412755 RepID=A0A0F9R1Z0_9ZZZZ
MTKRIDVLDHHGFVELVDVMGDDQAIIDAARVSIAGENVRPVQENRGLIRYLMRKRHTTPFEMVELKFRAKMPIFVARQWVRHRTASINEMSARYSELPAESYTPLSIRLMRQSKNNKQGSASETVLNADLHAESFKRESDDAFSAYQYRLEAGMARELARINLPLSTYTQWIWKIDLHNLFHFLSLRLDSHAQYEIRVYAEAMAELIKPIVPLAWEAFEDYRLNGMFLTRHEVKALAKILATASVPAVDKGDFPTEREADEFLDKVQRFVNELGWGS